MWEVMLAAGEEFTVFRDASEQPPSIAAINDHQNARI
jgi:hypothetical protein